MEVPVLPRAASTLQAMSEGFAPRFAIEAVFLILLGVGAGYADLSTPVIVGLVAGGWVIVALIELSVWRSQTRSSVEFAPQPAPADHPWRSMPHHGMTPHISGSSLSAQARYAAGTREILESWFGGTPIRDEYLIVDGGKLAGTGAHSYSTK